MWPEQSPPHGISQSGVVCYISASFLLQNRTSLDQTTLNQSVSVNGVHSDTSQVSHFDLPCRWCGDIEPHSGHCH